MNKDEKAAVAGGVGAVVGTGGAVGAVASTGAVTGLSAQGLHRDLPQ